MALECVFTVLKVFCVGENVPRSTLTGNFYDLVVRECVSCRREHSEVHLTGDLQGLVAPECVSCR